MTTKIQTIQDSTRRAAVMLLAMMLTTATAWAQNVGDVYDSGTCGTNLSWTRTYNDDPTVSWANGTDGHAALTLTITGSGDMSDFEYSTKPWQTEGQSITRVILPDGLTRIGNYAFNMCTNVKSITIPASVTSIGELGMNSLGSRASSAATVTFAEGSQLSSVGTKAFGNANANLDLRPCTKLTAITAELVFQAYTHTVTFPRSMTSVCANAFKGSTKPTVKLSYQGFLFINGEYQSYNANGATRTITSKFSITNNGSDAVTIRQGTIDGLTWNADGSYVEVNSEQGLVNLGDLVGADTSNTFGALTFKLTADLDFTSMPTRNKNGNSGNFHPIGLVEDGSFNGYFSGHFDGQNHTIKALRYTNNLASGSNNNEPVGLFKKVDGSSAVVERVVLIDPQMSGTNSGCGGVAGVIRNGATIRNCTVLGGSIVYTGLGKSGGIVGSNSSYAATIEGCTVIGTSVQNGMIIGYANSQQTIKDCIYYTTNDRGITQDVYTDGGGNQRVYQLTLGENVTATGAAYSNVLLPGKAYYASGATVTLGHGDAATGYTFGGYTATPAQTITDGTFTMPAEDVTVSARWTKKVLALADDGSNATAIATAAESGKVYEVTLTGRTLYKDGKWNTICLPFDVTISGSVLNGTGVVARTLTEASIEGTTLNLTFGDAVTTLSAGVPYIIKWTKDDENPTIDDPVFSGVTIDATDNSFDNGVSGDERVRFLGTYKSTTFTDEDKSILFLGTENTLYYPQPDIDTENPENSKYPTIGAQRAYFKIGDGALARQLTAFNIDFGSEETGIVSVSKESGSEGMAGAWFSLDGVRIDGKPTRKGLYIHNGRKEVVK